MNSVTQLGLRIDVDTYRGTKLGVPALCALLSRHGIQASWFFSVGPDNMGRHLKRLIRPEFFLKMLRSNAPSLYGWDILFRGTFGSGPIIGKHLKNQIRLAAYEGHEIGFHAWDHYSWQMYIDKMSPGVIRDHIKRGSDLLEEAAGVKPACSASPSWKCTDLVLEVKEEFPFLYNSDCRGTKIFNPVVSGRMIQQPQIPITLPTYDEVIGRNGINDRNYNDYILSLLRPGILNTLTIHAEVEGISRHRLFADFLSKIKERKIECLSLGELARPKRDFGRAGIARDHILGRDGWVACETTSLAA